MSTKKGPPPRQRKRGPHYTRSRDKQTPASAHWREFQARTCALVTHWSPSGPPTPAALGVGGVGRTAGPSLSKIKQLHQKPTLWDVIRGLLT